MLYPLEKLCLEKAKIKLAASLATAYIAFICCHLDGLASTIQNVLTALSLAINLARLWGGLPWGRRGVQWRQCELGSSPGQIPVGYQAWPGIWTLRLGPLLFCVMPCVAINKVLWPCKVMFEPRYVMDDVIWCTNSVMWIYDDFMGSWIVCIMGIPDGKSGSPQSWYQSHPDLRRP
jgi:hypothetical protein